ncbi:hypothetical protein MMC14_008114 [Varicellaria rhodocarpa]|nr:hypothetical protein [Varicellaria rhodocarpa]
MPHNNPFLLASDNSPKLIPLLRSNPSLASSQDHHGYSLMHAATSYNHIDLLRTLVNEFGVDVNIKDEDGETALFVAETVEVAQVLVEDFKIDTGMANAEGLTAEKKIRGEGDFPTVADYLQESRTRKDASRTTSHQAIDEIQGSPDGELYPAPPLPPNVTINVGTMDAAASDTDGTDAADPEFRRRIEELAAREDFQTEAGQTELRELIKDAVKGVAADAAEAERDVRRRI